TSSMTQIDIHIYSHTLDHHKYLHSFPTRRSSDLIRKQFERDDKIKVPEMIRELSTKNVLVMEFIDGIPINHHAELEAHGYSREVLAERLANSVFHQIIIEGFFHGDPHPGNVSVLEDETIAFMDFGMVGRLSQEMKYNFGTLL